MNEAESSDPARDWVPKSERRKPPGQPKWKLFLFIFGFMFIAGGGCVGFALYRSIQADRHCREFLDAALPQIVQSWKLEELDKRSSSGLKAATTPEQMAKLFSECSERLGPLQKYGEAQGQVRFGSRASFAFGSLSGVDPTGESYFYGQYASRCKFERALADISILTVSEDGEWKIHGFYVNSDALIP